jgi:hypothetical protein
MKSEQRVPEIYCDLNARMTENGYSLERRGSIDDFAKLGLTLEQAVGKQFVFNGGADTDEDGRPADIMFNGSVIKDSQWGYLAISDEHGLYWRVHA